MCVCVCLAVNRIARVSTSNMCYNMFRLSACMCLNASEWRDRKRKDCWGGEKQKRSREVIHYSGVRFS